MPMLMIKCKTCGEVFAGVYLPEEISSEAKQTLVQSSKSHTCSRGHENEYSESDFMDWS